MEFYLKVLVLALIQGAAELLPVSSSAHVILAEKLMGLEPDKPSMVFLLIMLHTGTMFAAVVYFWSSWKALLFPARGIAVTAPAGAGKEADGGSAPSGAILPGPSPDVAAGRPPKAGPSAPSAPLPARFLGNPGRRFVLMILLATAATAGLRLGLAVLIQKLL